MTRIVFAAVVLVSVAWHGHVHAQAVRPGFRPDVRAEYRTPHATNTLVISDCRTVPSGLVAGQEVRNTLLQSCRVHLVSRTDDTSGSLSTVLDTRTVFAWMDDYWWTETRHGAWVIHRFFVQQERVFITRMASFPELPQAYEGSRLQ